MINQKDIILINHTLNKLGEFLEYPKSNIYNEYINLVMLRNIILSINSQEAQLFNINRKKLLRDCNRFKKKFMILFEKNFKDIPDIYFKFDPKNIKLFKDNKNDDILLFKRMTELELIDRSLKALKSAQNIIEVDDIVNGMLNGLSLSLEQILDYIKTDIVEESVPDKREFIINKYLEVLATNDSDKEVCKNLLKNYKADFSQTSSETYVSSNPSLSKFLASVDIPDTDLVKAFYDAETDVEQSDDSSEEDIGKNAKFEKKPKNTSAKKVNKDKLGVLDYTDELNKYKDLKIPSREELSTEKEILEFEKLLDKLEKNNSKTVKIIFTYYKNLMGFYISKRVREEDYKRDIKVFQESIGKDTEDVLNNSIIDINKAKEILLYISTRFNKAIGSDESIKKAESVLKYFLVDLIGSKGCTSINKKVKSSISQDKKKVSDIYNVISLELVNYIVS